MNKRLISLSAVFAVLGLVYVFFFLLGNKPQVQAMFVQPTGGTASFGFNTDVTFEEIKVVKVGVEPAEGEVFSAPVDEIVWHMIPRELQEGEEPTERPAIRTLRYGQGVTGLRRAKGIPRKGKPLEPGVLYRLEATFDSGDVVLDFRPR